MSLVASSPPTTLGSAEHRRVRQLERTVGELRERVRQLESALAPPWMPPAAWGLTRSEAAIFSMLLRRDVVTMEMFALILDPEIDVEIDGLVKVLMCKTRRKLRPYGVRIEVVRGVGYTLSARLSWKAKLG